jgi:hypothetical protein
MRKLLVLALTLTIVGSAMAFDLGNQAGDKPVVNYPQNIPGDRQGGDTILDAVLVALPVINGSGTTAGYNDDYDEVCPYGNSTSPDVVYTAIGDGGNWSIDLLGSTYDTKVYVYDENLALVACNDDFYPDFVSKIENVALMSGVQYFIVVDGYGGDFGNYVINIVPFEPCALDCPAGAELEGEPPLVDNYADAYNGGCNSPEFGNPFTSISNSIFCGVAGWYLNGGIETRDTDWFTITCPAEGFFEVIGDAEQPTYLFELGPQDCGSVGVIQNVIIGACSEGTMVIPGAPGSTIWFWVGPTTFTGPVNEYDYVLFSNLEGTIATEDHSWTGVKALFE